MALVVGTLAAAAGMGWPNWVWFPVIAAVAGAFLLDIVVLSPHDRDSGSDEEADQAAEDPSDDAPYLEAPVFDVPVRSAKEEYPFLFSATILWRATPEFDKDAHGNPAGLAVASVLRRVESLTEVEQPERVEFLRHWLEGLVGVPVHDGTEMVMACAVDVRLTLRHLDRRHLDEIEELKRSVSSWERRREHERDKRTYLGEDVLRSPGSAVVWWLARHEEEAERAVDLIGPLACLAAAANDQELPEEFRHLAGPREQSMAYEAPDGLEYSAAFGGAADREETPDRPAGPPRAASEHVAALLDSMGLARGSEERLAHLHRMVRMAEATGRPEAAEALREALRREQDGVWEDESSDVHEAHPGGEDDPDVGKPHEDDFVASKAGAQQREPSAGEPTAADDTPSAAPPDAWWAPSDDRTPR
ncbi:hypothetical protein [Streptomyces sp. NRRL F-2799]|uniref:hypothetical protein n=1 Tax=Streptomyces sp. NRRL F-2799 TaxID=1463844 RepID=UPI00068CC09B|nr:hypothetical protein [Streptomyces sp. NRRL F-2799]